MDSDEQVEFKANGAVGCLVSEACGGRTAAVAGSGAWPDVNSAPVIDVVG